MSPFDLFKAGCELLAAGAQAFWDSLNLFEQIVAFVGCMFCLGAFTGWLCGKIALWRRARRERKQRAVVPEQREGTLAHKYANEGKLNDVEIARLSELHYSPLFEFGGECHIVERSIPVRVFDVKREAEVWLEQCQRQYKPGKDGAA